MMLSVRLLFAAIAAFLLFDSVVRAEPSGRVATRLQEVDGDFAFMGEYMGWVAADCSRPRGPKIYVGMQVIALGEGRFAATAYHGGLPGNGWNRKVRFRLEGELQGKQLVLAHQALTVTIRDVYAQVQGPHQEQLGTLRKMIRRSPTLGKRPPRCALVLFDGHNATAFKNPRIINGLLQAGTELIPRFRNYKLHIEFLVPYKPDARSQGRGNSGVYLQSRYEVQILDSFGLEGKPNECGGLYRYRAPDQNMAFPPLTWQTYDITFRAPRFDRSGHKIRNARITVLHNGVPIHNNVALQRKTGAGKKEGPNPLAIKLQDHGNPVQFRNVWLLQLR